MIPQKLLLSNKYKKIGWFIFAPAAVLGIIWLLIGSDRMAINARVFALIYGDVPSDLQFFNFIDANVINTIIGILFIVGGLLIGFSKEKNEDEFIASLRQTSLLWAVLVNYILLLFAFVFIYGTAVLNVMLYNMFTVLIIFIARFNYVLYRTIKSTPGEKYN